MKRILNVILVSVVMITVSRSQISSDGTIGTSGTYATLQAAFTAANGGVTGNITLTIISDLTETGSPTLTTTTLNGTTNTLTIKPSGAARTIAIPTTDSIYINGSDYVTFDGALTGTSRDLTIRHSGTPGTNPVIRVGTGSTNITVKNCKIGSTNTPDCAISVDGASGILAITIQNNEIHGTGNTQGIIYLNRASSATIAQDSISGTAAGASKAYGIYIGPNCTGTITIEKNKLHTLKSSGSGQLVGIKEDGGSSATLNIYNNFIGGNFSSTSTPTFYTLIDLNSSAATRNIYHNTLVLNNINAGYSACVAMLFGIVNQRNNIMWNTSSDAFSSCIYMDTSLFTSSDLTSNYNNLYSTTVAISINVASDGTSYYDLGGWQSTFSKDPNSKNIAPSLATSTGSSSNFHLLGPYVFGGDGDERLTGFNLTATVTDDIDGEPRRTGIGGGMGQKGPYMGADESTNELPIQLTAINVTSSRLDATLKWSTATEVNNHGFEIERRSVGASTSSVWEKVGFISGSGTSSSPKNYSYVDANLPAGRYAYRIKQIDNDGSFTYYLAAEVEVGVTEKVLALESNYPNPFNPSTNIAFSVPENGKVALKVFNILGQEVAVLFDGIAEAGKLYQQTFNASQFPTGLYFSRLEFGGKSLMRKMLFVK